MSEHERIRELLPLASSGDLTPEAVRDVREHLSRCPECRRISEDFAALAGALGALPTPQPSAAVRAQVHEWAASRLPRERAWGGDTAAVAALVAASWIMAVTAWPVAQPVIRWLLTGWYAPGAGLGTALAAYTIIGFLLACVSALAAAGSVGAIGRSR